MKFFAPIFSILVVIFLLGSTASFLAESLVFLTIEIYSHLYKISGIWLALSTTILGVILVSYVLFLIAKEIFFRTFKNKPTEEGNMPNNKVSRINKVIISFVLYELLKLIYKKLKAN
jgi:hypothetical protein